MADTIIGRMEPLQPAFRRELRARAHHLHPVVVIGHHGLTPAVLHEIDVALIAHELIKVRVFSDDRGEREALSERICTALDCGLVQQIGKLIVLWRRRPAKVEADESQPPARRPRPAAARHWAATQASRRPAGVDKPASRAAATGAPPAARRRRAGKAPSGVPRAAAPRRRRGF
jgi:putative YhbY family RNA-binding protein